jgi:hypothetical protein
LGPPHLLMERGNRGWTKAAGETSSFRLHEPSYDTRWEVNALFDNPLGHQARVRDSLGMLTPLPSGYGPWSSGPP